MRKRKQVKRKTSSFTKVKKRALKILAWTGLASVILLGIVGGYAVRNVFQPIQIDASTAQEEVSLHTSQEKFFTLFINQEGIVQSASLTKVNSEEDKITELVLPAELLLRLPYGLNEFKLQSLYKIADVSNKPTHTVIKQALIEYFGLSATDLYIIDSETPQTFKNWLSNPLTLFRLTFDEQWSKKMITTSNSRWDLVTKYQTFNTIPEQNIKITTLKETDIVSFKKGVDNTTEVITDQNKLDSYIRNNFQSDSIMEENANIIVENASGTALLGARIARYLNNIGSTVIEIKNGEVEKQQTTIYLKNKDWETSQTVKYIITSFPEAQVIVDPAQNSKSEILISIGQNCAQVITGQ